MTENDWGRGEELPSTEELEELVIQWAKDRNLLYGTTSKDKMCKLIQEVGELSDEICKENVEKLESELGDNLVILAQIARQNGLTLARCLNTAYHKIKNRGGITRNGVFIKEEDL